MLSFEVADSDTAESLGSGDVPVLATPRLIAWMEAATVQAAARSIAAEQTTVGTAVRVQHRRPTPVGGRIAVTVDSSSSSSSSERQLTFAVTAVDGHRRVVATGEIDRAIVDRARFVAGAQEKPAA